MSFGWSVGDLIAAINLLTKIGCALRDVGGASSEYQDATSFLGTLQVTLESLKSLYGIPIEARTTDNLLQQCEHIRVPLEAFLDGVNRRYDASLGSSSHHSRLLSAPRKIQWALHTSKKIRQLQERIAVPMAAVNMLLGLQTIDSILRIPEQIQITMSSALESTLPGHLEPLIESVHDVLEAHNDKITQSQDSTSQRIIKANGDSNKLALDAIQALDISGRAASSKLHARLEEIGSAVVLVHQELCSLPQSRQALSATKESVELQAIEDVFRSLWQLISSLQQLVRALLIIVAPYLLAMFNGSIGRLMLAGDHFTFEDALGRMTRLPCSQFQDWKNFYDFLTESFANSPGLDYVIRHQFRVLNGFNNVVIHQEHWNASIQPKAKMVMSMLLKHRVLGKACPLSSCKGVVALNKTGTLGKCSICSRFVSLEPPVQDERPQREATSLPTIASRNRPQDITILPLEGNLRHAKSGRGPPTARHTQDGILKSTEATETRQTHDDGDVSGAEIEITAFKRVSVVPIESKKNTFKGSPRDGMHVLGNLLYTWAPYHKPTVPTEEILKQIQQASLYEEFMAILASHQKGDLSILRCSDKISELFPPESHYDLNMYFKDTFRSGFNWPLMVARRE
ncbi:hypothetical protein BKA65DRAFT_142867 [Rhexocercosporidium sp. MPI-PUGE-AT-0058]|nr:hypothetical protein BKA65DRAFT_142867 [Rhexocercosporidium sp. MPI-PUGE-AT-0058]